jgi:hypothetical protein
VGVETSFPVPVELRRKHNVRRFDVPPLPAMRELYGNGHGAVALLVVAQNPKLRREIYKILIWRNLYGIA